MGHRASVGSGNLWRVLSFPLRPSHAGPRACRQRMRRAEPKEFFRRAQAVLIMRRILPTRLLVVLFFGVSWAAQELPAPRVGDLKAPDGTTLNATFFAAAKRGPGLWLLHQCKQQRQHWNELAA